MLPVKPLPCLADLPFTPKQSAEWLTHPLDHVFMRTQHTALRYTKECFLLLYFLSCLQASSPSSIRCSIYPIFFFFFFFLLSLLYSHPLSLPFPFPSLPFSPLFLLPCCSLTLPQRAAHVSHVRISSMHPHSWFSAGAWAP